MNIYQELKSIEFSNITNDFVQLFKETGQLKDKTLVVPFNISVSDFENNITRNASLTFLFYSPTNYTKVAVTDKNSFDLVDGTEIEFLAEHDSCWREGISRKLRPFIEDFIKEIKKSGMENIYIDTTIGFGVRFLNFHIIGSYGDNTTILKKS